MKPSRLIPPLLLPLAASLVACGPQGGTDVGNGRTVKLQLEGYEAASTTSTQSLTTSGGVFVEHVWVAVDRVRFSPATDCEEDETEIDIEGPLVADLVGTGILGGPPSFPVTTVDRFCKLKVGFDPLEAGTEPEGSPAALTGASIRVEGARADGELFTVTSRLDERLELEANEADGFALPAGSNPLFVAFELGSWIEALALDSLPVGPIVIDDDNNSDRLDPFEDAVKASIKLLRDADEDGDVDADELEDELAD